MVRPIDIADHLAKTQAAEKVNQIQKAAPDMDQRQFALQLEGKLIRKHEQANPTVKTDEVIIHRDNPKKEQQQKKKKDEDKKKKSDVHLDVKA
ncbi:MAG: hypothetical protein KAT85_10715 [candidate division Zixibacteria bacterium]|jgi:hypothetical protein|nr:hypothetical protein [candidate division Zixibacteria bacterium]